MVLLLVVALRQAQGEQATAEQPLPEGSEGIVRSLLHLLKNFIL